VRITSIEPSSPFQPNWSAPSSRPSSGGCRSRAVRRPAGPAGALARAVLEGDAEAALKAVDEGADVSAELPD